MNSQNSYRISYGVKSTSVMEQRNHFPFYSDCVKWVGGDDDDTCLDVHVTKTTREQFKTLDHCSASSRPRSAYMPLTTALHLMNHDRGSG